jgi:hypothetical protein
MCANAQYFLQVSLVISSDASARVKAVLLISIGFAITIQNESPEEESEDRTHALEQVLPHEILALGESFPTSPSGSPVVYANARFHNLVGYLPDPQKATSLREIYYQRAAWMFVASFM